MISGTLYRPNGTVWAGGVLTVRLVSTFSNTGQTVVPQTWRVTASAAGVVSLSILVPDSGSASYIFTLPDGTQSAAQLLGTGAAIVLETIFTTALADPTAETELATLIAASAVGLAPATTPRNIVQPTTDVVPLTVAARAAGQTANLTEWKNTTGTVVASLSPTGVFTGGFVASGLTVASFASPNVGQWTNDLGYLTSGAADALFLTPTEGNAAYVLRSGSLADLTTRSASDLSSGTLPDARFPATLPVGSGVNLTALNASNLASGTLPDARFPATLPAASGVNLTALNASNLGSGTVPAARLSGVPTVINVKDAPYSATGDATTNDRAALDAAATASSTGAPLYFPRGTYAIASNWTTPAGVVLQFAAGAILKPASAVVITISGPVEAPSTQIFDTSAAGSFALLRQNAQVDWFGADPTGVADSSVAITAAVAALTAGQGGVVQFSPGKYLANVSLTGAISGITLRGAGAYTSTTAKGTQLMTNSTTLDVITIAPSAAAIQSVVIEDLFVLGRTSDTTGHGIFIDATAQTISHVRISNVGALNTKQNGIYLKAGQGSGGFLFDVQIDNYKTAGADIGLSILGRVSQVVVSKPYVSAVTTAVSIDGGTSAAEAGPVTLIQPVLATAATGLYLKDAVDVHAYNLYTESLTTRQIWLQSARRIVIDGGQIKQTGTAKGIDFDVSTDTSGPNDRIYVNAPGWTNTSDKTLITYTAGTSTEVHFGSYSSGPIARANVTGTESGTNQFKFDAALHTKLTVDSSGNLSVDAGIALLVPATSPITDAVAPIQVGSRGVSNSSDASVLNTRLVDDSVSGNGHAFSDSSLITRTGVIGYNSFDARIDIGSTSDYNHYAAFQAAPDLGTSGTTTSLYGLFHNPTVSAGTVTNTYGLKVQNITGAGAVTNQYGVYVSDLTKGATLNYGVYVAGTTPSYFGGNFTAGGALTGLGNLNIGVLSPASGNVTIYGTGPHVIGGAANANIQLLLKGAFAPTGQAEGLNISSAITAAASQNAYGLHVAPTLVEAGSGTHGYFLGSYFTAPTITAGAAAVTNAVTVYINNAPTGTFTGVNAALWVGAGLARFDGAVGVGSTLTFSPTAPTVSSGFGTSPVITGTATAFSVNVGTGGSATGGVLTLPAATNGWICDVRNLTALAANRADQRTVQTASSTTTATVQNQTISTGAALAWTASDLLQLQCTGY